MADEVALFVDLENVVTSMWKEYQQGSDPLMWMEKARNYGPVTFARAFGDFQQESLAKLENQLRVAGIDPFPCPVKVRDTGTQSTVDMNVVIDVFEVAIDRPTISTFILMAGDRDYIRIVARLRSRWGKRVIISGVPGSVSRELVMAAGEEDPILPSALLGLEGELELIRIIDRYERTLQNGFYPTFGRLERYVAHPTNNAVIPAHLVRRQLTEFVQRGVLMQVVQDLPEGGQLKSTSLNRADPLVNQALQHPCE